MESIEITSVSSRGQVVIPRRIREKLNLQEGEKFVVIGEKNTIVFTKLDVPSFNGFEKLLKKTQDHAKKYNLTEKDIEESIKESRKK